MAKESVKTISKTAKENNSKEKKQWSTDLVLEKISKAIIFLIVFLLPLFFLPWTSNVLNFNKQALLLGLGFTALFLWLARVLITGKIKISLSKFHIPVALWLIVYLAAALFSQWFYGSFWGWPQSVSQSFLTLLSFVIFYFLLVNLFEKKEVFNLAVVFLGSSLLAAAIAVLQLFGKFIFPFAKSASFNTVGSLNQLALFSAVLTPLLVLLILKTKRVLKVVLHLALIAVLFLLVLADFNPAWWLVLAASVLIIFFGVQKRETLGNYWLFLSMILLAAALFIGVFNFNLPGLPERPLEVYLNYETSWDIVWKTVKESPILGSGPGTFVYNFSQHKDVVMNSTLGWNMRFDSARSEILDIGSDSGVLGALSFLFLVGTFVFLGIKSFFSGKASNKDFWLLRAGLFGSFLLVASSYFIYNASLVMGFSFFFLIGSLLVLSSPERKDIELKSSSLLSLGITFAVTLAFIFGLGLLILEGQKYSAEAYYLQGTKDWQRGEIDKGVGSLEKSATLSPGSDLYWRDLSRLYLREINYTSSRKDLNKNQINQRIQLFVSNAIGAAKKATDVNPKNVANWSVRGLIYQNLVGVVEGAGDWALTSYDRAQELEPVSPYYPTQKGMVLLSKASLSEEKEAFLFKAEKEFKRAVELKSDYAPARFQMARLYQIQGKTVEAIGQMEETKKIAPNDVGVGFQLGVLYFNNEDYQKARSELERVVSLSPEYSNALYFLGLTYDKQGEKGKAIETFEKIAELNPGNKEIESAISNLKEGKPALEDLREEKAEVPIEESPPEVESEE